MSKLFQPNHLHALVYFVADKATKHNVSPDVPLVGTDSYRTLLDWIADMDVDITRVRLYNQDDRPFDNALSRISLNRAIELNQIRIVALGQKAATYLRKTGINNYFLLPHPSGRNRLLNDKKFVKLKLNACRRYIYEGVSDGQQKYKKGSSQNLFSEQKLSPATKSGKLE